MLKKYIVVINASQNLDKNVQKMTVHREINNSD